jgi:hypothetical protein
MLENTLLPNSQSPAHDNRLLAQLEQVSHAGATAFLAEAHLNQVYSNLRSLAAIDDILAGLQTRFAQNPRFLEIRFDWAHATALALLRPDATDEQKKRVPPTIATCQNLLPLLGKDWRRHTHMLQLLNRAGRTNEADTFAQKLYDNAGELGVSTSDDWTALGNAIEFSNGSGKLYQNLGYECYARAVEIDTKTTRLNFAAIIGRLRLGALNNLKPEEALDIVNQLVARFPEEAAAREAEVFFVRKRLCQLIVDSGRHTDAVLAYAKLAEASPKDRYLYHYNAALSLVAYCEAAAKNADWTATPPHNPQTSFDRVAVENIFDNFLAKNAGNSTHIAELKHQRSLLNISLAIGASKTAPTSATTVQAAAAFIRELSDTSPASQKSQFAAYEAYLHATRLKTIYDHADYSQSQLDEARALRSRIESLGGPNVDFARRVCTWIEASRARQQAARDTAARQQEADTRAASAANYQTRPAAEPRWRWCMRCSGTGYRTVWEDAQDPYTGRYRRAQVNKPCDRCWGKGTLPY